MDVRNAKIEPTIEHGGTCKTFFMFPKESIRSATEGSYLEYVSEFEIAPGTHLEPHKHNTHEFFYILSSRALMQVGRDKREVEPGDLIHIPPKHRSRHRPVGHHRPDAGLGVCRKLPAAGRVGYGGRTGRIAGVAKSNYRHRRRGAGAVREWRPAAMVLSGRTT